MRQATTWWVGLTVVFVGLVGCRTLLVPEPTDPPPGPVVPLRIVSLDGSALAGATVDVDDEFYLRQSARGHRIQLQADADGYVQVPAIADSLVDVGLQPPELHGGPRYTVLSVDLRADSVVVTYPLAPVQRQLMSTPDFEIAAGEIELTRIDWRAVAFSSYRQELTLEVDSLGTAHGWLATGAWQVYAELFTRSGGRFTYRTPEPVASFANRISAALASRVELAVALAIPDSLPRALSFQLYAVATDPVDAAQVSITHVLDTASWAGRALLPPSTQEIQVRTNDNVLLLSDLNQAFRDPDGPLEVGPLQLGEFWVQVGLDPGWPAGATVRLELRPDNFRVFARHVGRFAPELLLLDRGSYRVSTYLDEIQIRDEVWEIDRNQSRTLPAPN